VLLNHFCAFYREISLFYVDVNEQIFYLPQLIALTSAQLKLECKHQALHNAVMIIEEVFFPSLTFVPLCK